MYIFLLADWKQGWTFMYFTIYRAYTLSYCFVVDVAVGMRIPPQNSGLKTIKLIFLMSKYS